MKLYEEIEKIKTQGYSEDDAQSKLGQDIILKAIFDSGLAGNATIKGGVVMRSISGEARRATQDLDLDFIRYSISNESIRRFVEKLKSMVRFGSRNTRYKDVFDICYLSERVKMDQLKDCIQKYIFADNTLRNVSSMEDIVNRIERMFHNPGYLRELNRSGKNWLDISTAEALETDLEFIRGIQF